ncbi:MAG: BatA domain-containing protein [bacterium]|nr:BatA domain-containing protein [bacterium]
MSFLSPIYFLFLIAIPIVIFLYLLRTRRQILIVPSIYLWKRYTKEELRYSVFKKFLKDILLILQILTIILLTLGLVKPAIFSSVIARNVVFIIDTSCSMQAKDIKPTRFDLAREKALEKVDALGRGTSISVFASDSKTKFLLDYTTDKRLVKEVIKRLYPTDTEGDIGETLSYIEKLNKKPDLIYVFTDGAFEENIPPNLNIELLTFSKDDNNAGITDISARDTGIKGEKEIFIKVKNFSKNKKSIPLQVWEGERLIETDSLDLNPKEERIVIVGPKRFSGIVKAMIYPNDLLSTDDKAYLTFPRVKPSVLLVTKENPYLEIALSLADISILDKTDSFNLEMLSKYDIVIFDGTAPNDILPGNYIFIGKIPSNIPLQVVDITERPTIIRVDATSPIMRFVNLNDMTIKRAVVFESSQGKSLIKVKDGSILWSYEGNLGRIVTFGFYLEESSLIESPSFPILVKNIIGWLGENPSPGVAYTGNVITLRTKKMNEDVTIITPYGVVKRETDDRRSITFGDTYKVGVYSFKSSVGNIDVGVNLCSFLESDISPKVSSKEFKGNAEYRERVLLNTDVWKFLVLGALGTIFLEGYLFYGRRKVS